MRKVLVLDTSVLCVWLKVPGMASCGPDADKWDYTRIDRHLTAAVTANCTLVLPLASILETGNHIAQSTGDRHETAERLAELMVKAAEQTTPWAAFTDQSILWTADKLKNLATTWPPLAATKLSIGDATIKDVAEYYANMGITVEILTGDSGLKAHQPATPPLIPRRRK